MDQGHGARSEVREGPDLSRNPTSGQGLCSRHSTRVCAIGRAAEQAAEQGPNRLARRHSNCARGALCWRRGRRTCPLARLAIEVI